jgi:four helix bundle protein
MQDFRRLIVWQKSHKLTLAIYKMSQAFPPEERFGLTSQLRRASSSIPANIAEGCGRSSRIELKHFLHVAMGSASEVEYFLYLARDLGLLTPTGHLQADKSVTEIKRMLTGLVESLKRTAQKN